MTGSSGGAGDLHSALFLAPEVARARGGIQRLGRDLVEALRCAEPGRTPGVLVLNDSQGEIHDGWPTSGARGFAGNRGRFVGAALRAVSRHRVIILGHRNFLPLAVALKLRRSRAETWLLLYGVEAHPTLTWLERGAMCAIDRVIAISPQTAAAFRASGCHRAVELWPCGLPSTWSMPEARPPRFESPCRWLSVARLVRSDGYKGVDHTIEALAFLPRGSAVLDIVGDGDDLPRLRQWAQDRGVSDHVRFHGGVSDGRLRELYGACDVFVLPSRGEGFGIVYLEAMAYAKPVVAADAGGAPFVVRPGVSGALVPYAAPEHIASCVTEWMRDPGSARRLGQSARRLVEQTFSFRAFVTRAEDLLGTRHREPL